MPNPTGKNGHQNGQVPPDDVLHAKLLEYALEEIPLRQRLVRLRKELSYNIQARTLKRLNQRFDIPSARKFRLLLEAANQLVIDKVAQDVNGLSGPETIRKKITLESKVIIPRHIVRQIMHANWDDQFDERFPGRRKSKIRGQLHAIGPWHEIHADGHEKIDHKALKMGGVGIPIYAFRDKWSGAPLRLVVIPNDRLAAAIGHIYLDMIEDYKVVPIQATFDKGTETSYTGSFQISLRQEFAPDLDVEEFPPFVTLKSTDNILIEAFWPWLLKDCGINLKTVLQEGQTKGIFMPGNSLHVALFNWIWPKVVQDLLDDFYTYWINHRVRKQANKLLPSGMTPKEAYFNPEYYGSSFVGIPVTNPDIIPALRRQLPITHDEAFCWVSSNFENAADLLYTELNSPKMSILTGWEIFQVMLPLLKQLDPETLDL